jgi:hypothetical protein
VAAGQREARSRGSVALSGGQLRGDDAFQPTAELEIGWHGACAGSGVLAELCGNLDHVESCADGCVARSVGVVRLCGPEIGHNAVLANDEAICRREEVGGIRLIRVHYPENAVYRDIAGWTARSWAVKGAQFSQYGKRFEPL